MRPLIVSSLMLALTMGLPAVSVAGPGAGQAAFGVRSRAALARNLGQQLPYALTGTESDESAWRVERRALTSTTKRASSFVYKRTYDGR